MDASPQVHVGFSTQKREILLRLKHDSSSTLKEIAAALGISKVAALRHLAALESDGLVEREYRAGRVGRPHAEFRLSRRSSQLFPQAYTQMSLSALGFIQQRLGRDAVVSMLQQRSHEVAVEIRPRFQQADLPARVTELARVRDEGGYMAEVGRRKPGVTEMLEHNCPILAIAERYPEACDVERRMFESLLRANVEVAHRVVAGDPVCRFLIRPKTERK